MYSCYHTYYIIWYLGDFRSIIILFDECIYIYTFNSRMIYLTFFGWPSNNPHSCGFQKPGRNRLAQQIPVCRAFLKMTAAPSLDAWAMEFLWKIPSHLGCLNGCVWKCCVPLNPMVLLIIIPMKNGYFIGNIPYFQTNPNREHIRVQWG